VAPENATALLETLLGGDAGLAPLKQPMLARTGSNPLFLEESVRSLVEDGVLAVERSAYRLREDAGDRPRDVNSAGHALGVHRPVAAGRQDAAPDCLGGRARRPGRPAHGCRRGSAGGLADRLTRLQAAEFLYETSLLPDAEYTFRHALTHEVAYGSLLQDRRRALHACALTAIEGANPAWLGEHIERLTHHALRGELWEKAVTYSWQSSEKANARSANREAVRYAEAVLEAAKHVPQTPDATAQAIDLRLLLERSL
jgi:predicted ATPase